MTQQKENNYANKNKTIKQTVRDLIQLPKTLSENTAIGEGCSAFLRFNPSVHIFLMMTIITIDTTKLQHNSKAWTWRKVGWL